MAASVPELTMRTISIPGMAATTASARATSAGQGAPKLVPRAAASWMARVTAGWAWPSSIGPQDMT